MKKIIIIGAGPAGLTAAYELLNNSQEYEVIILEESDRFGGISQTVRYNGNRMDIGGHRFFSKDQRVVEWWADFMPTQGAPAYDDKLLGRSKPLESGGPDPEKEDRVMLVRDRVSRIYYNNKFFDYPITMKPDTIKNMGFVTTVKSGFSYLKAIAAKKPETSLESFYINRFGKVLYSMFFEGYTEKLWGRHPRDISADWGSQRVKGLSIKAVLKDMMLKILPIKQKKVETSLIEQFIYPKFGPGQLWETVADECKKLGAKIKTNCKVTGIQINNGIAETVVYTENGIQQTQKADIILSTMPFRDLIMGIDEAPKDIKTIAEGLPYRDFITIGVLVNKLSLKNTTDKITLGNIVPDCWIYVQDTGIKMGRIQIFNNWSPYMVKDPENTVWLGTEYFCDEGDNFWAMDQDQRVDFAIKELEKMNIISSEDVIDAHCEKVKKAYPAYFDTYSQVDQAIEYVNSLENIYCLGRNGQHRYNNMDHSMATAFVAVENIIQNKLDKNNVWGVNTDDQYHETKQSS